MVPFDDGIVMLFLDPNDAAVSKYARCEPRDRQWIQAGLGAALLSAPIIESRFGETEFLDAAERNRARKALDEDRSGLVRPRARRKFSLFRLWARPGLSSHRTPIGCPAPLRAVAQVRAGWLILE